MDGERERVVIRERDGWIDGWVNSTERSVVVVVLVGGASNGGEMFWWLWFSALKKKHQKNTREPNSTRLLHKGLVYNDAVYFIGVQ